MADIKLSLCIATFSRAAFIGETLESIISQVSDEVEIVIVDGASPDNTSEVVSGYGRKCPRLSYHRQEANRGVDEDFTLAVALARGEYCWLMSDDDVLKPGAIRAVLEATRKNFGLILVNGEVRNTDLSEILESGRLAISGDRVYGPSEFEKLFVDTAKYLSFIGCVVIRKSLWDAREKDRYFGTAFVHVGVIFQKMIAEDVLVIAEPYISIRYGNAQWSAKGFEIWMFKWPMLIWSFADFSDAAKKSVCPRDPWKRLAPLLLLRGLGSYSLGEYKEYLRPAVASRGEKISARIIASLPGRLVNFMAIFYYTYFRPSPRYVLDLRNSRWARGASARSPFICFGKSEAP